MEPQHAVSAPPSTPPRIRGDQARFMTLVADEPSTKPWDHWLHAPHHLTSIIGEEHDATLTRVASLAVEEFAECDVAGITVFRERRPVTAAFTDPDAPQIDAAQYATGSGPGIDACRHRAVARIEDTRTDTRWPRFTEAAAARGILSTLSVPMCVNDQAHGALNLYSHSANDFADETAPLQFATRAAVVLANAPAYWAANAVGSQLETALETRAVIEQAKGVLISRHGCGSDEAFTRLVDDSTRLRVPLRDVARAVVAFAVSDGADVRERNTKSTIWPPQLPPPAVDPVVDAPPEPRRHGLFSSARSKRARRRTR